VNGRELSERGLVDLRETMRRPGESLAVDVLRDGKRVAVTFTTARLV
jgi:S1-C subfamily serine protease